MVRRWISEPDLRLGWYISGAGHLVLILVLLFGGIFIATDPTDVTISEISILSEAEFAALVPPGVAPEIETEAPDVAAPEADAEPEVPSEDSAPDRSEAEGVETPETPDTPNVEIPEPLPEAVVVEDAPVLPLAPSEFDGSSLERDAVAAPAPRVADVPQVERPEAETSPEVVPDRAPEPSPVPEPTPEETPAAPEEASDRIVTEAEEVKTFAPASSKRPRTRPARPVRVAAEPSEEQPEPENSSSAIDAAVREVVEDTPVRRGPPLTGGEKDALKVAVGKCWNVGSLSTDALATTVVVSVEMEQSGKPITGSIQMVSASGGSEKGAKQAFEAARRAIIRCGARGFPLPVEKFGDWRNIEMVFNPEGMQFR